MNRYFAARKLMLPESELQALDYAPPWWMKRPPDWGVRAWAWPLVGPWLAGMYALHAASRLDLRFRPLGRLLCRFRRHRPIASTATDGAIYHCQRCWTLLRSDRRRVAKPMEFAGD